MLRPEGRYIFETPNRITGPHDVSRHFDVVSTGFHLKEYTHTELLRIGRASGFRSFRSPLFRHRMYTRAGWLARRCEYPSAWQAVPEWIGQRLPRAARLRLDRIFNIFVIATR